MRCPLHLTSFLAEHSGCIGPGDRMHGLRLCPLPKKLFRYGPGIGPHEVFFETGRGTEQTGDELFLRRTSASDIWVGEGVRLFHSHAP